jgi:hypothetical protein
MRPTGPTARRRDVLLAALSTSVVLGAVPGGLHAAPFPDRVAAVTVGEGGGFNQDLLPDIVLGGPRGGGLFSGSGHVFSLGRRGSITLEFTDSVIVDGPGPDFTVFENAFLTAAGSVAGPPFAEAAEVSVSADGRDFLAFPCALEDAAAFFPGCAGVFPVLANVDEPGTPAATVPTAVPIAALVGAPTAAPPPPGSGGDSFDLADLGIAAARFVRIVSGPGAVPALEGKAGFDLDAIAAVNWRPLVQGEDADGDGIADAIDLCPAVPDPEQRDADGDGRGDACDCCPATPDAAGQDRDGDGTGDACDPCPDHAACGPLGTAVFSGGGRRRDADTLVTFATPTSARVTLAPTAPGAELLVNFSADVVPDTFRASLGGKDARARFAPVVPGSSQRLILPLRGRRTRLVLRIEGIGTNGQRRRDVDRLLFRRQRPSRP